jgi:sec-independent protein translocase protein TatB
MELFGIGTTEFVVILLLGAIVLGPHRLAVTAREAGKLIRNLRNYLRVLSDDLGRELDILSELKDVQRELTKH